MVAGSRSGSSAAGASGSPACARPRGQSHGAELSRPIPIFNVRDLRRSQRYFREVLGFKVDWEDGDPPDFGSVSRGDAAIFMCQGCQGNPGAWVMISAATSTPSTRSWPRRRRS